MTLGSAMSDGSTPMDETRFRLQLVLNTAGPNSSSGYDASLFDMSEVFLHAPIQDIQDLRKTIKGAGFAHNPYTILYGGHVVDEMNFLDDEARHSGSLLAVPQDPIVKVVLPSCISVVSVGRHDIQVKTLKGILQDRAGTVPDRMLIFNYHGQALVESTPLSTVGCFGLRSALICRPQLDAYYKFQPPNQRLSNVLQAAQALQQNWCDVGDGGDVPAQVTESLVEKLNEMLEAAKATLPAEAALRSSSYDRFVTDFPPQDAPALKPSTNLVAIQDQFKQVLRGNSLCPTEAVRVAEKMIAKLNNKNVSYADEAAACLRDLSDPIIKLANKPLMIHEHDAYHNKIKQAEMALNRYRDIRAGKMYEKPEQYQEKLEAISALNAEMSKIANYFEELDAEWQAAQVWTDLSAFARVEAENLSPSTKRVTALVAESLNKVKEEADRLQELRKVEHDAAHHNLLIQEQVSWCQEVVRAAQGQAEADIADLDARIEALLAERASKEVLRVALERRMDSLERQAQAEANLFKTFQAQYAAKEAIVRQRLEHAEVGAAATAEFRDGLVGLQKSLSGELEALRVRAHELLLDVGSDCAAAHKVAHSVNHILGYYEAEKSKSLEEDVVTLSKKYQVAMVQMRTDKAEEYKSQVDANNANIAQCKANIDRWKAATADLDHSVTAPWEFVCRHALGGAVPPDSTRRAVVRTSEANRDAWDGEDRELETPHEWNREMEAEAINFKQGLLALGD